VTGSSHNARRWQKSSTLFLVSGACLLTAACGLPGSDLPRVNHIIIVMQENHSFDNYFGALAYAPGSPYRNGNGPCSDTDHSCVDGLTCSKTSGILQCTNSNADEYGVAVTAFKATTRCVMPDLDHSWLGTHREINLDNPNQALEHALNNGFVWQNNFLHQVALPESPADDQTMSFYDWEDLPFYYELAEKFAISDRQFSSVLGPTLPNRSYLLTATSFGLTANEFTPPGGYKPITGTIFDLLNAHQVSWADYFEDGAQDTIFVPDPAHNLPLATFFEQAAGVGTLPQVAWIDPAFSTSATILEDDEHPPSDIQRGQSHISEVVNAVRNGPHWEDSIIFITYDEHGGFYDHVHPPPARQDGDRTPDGIFPGQCRTPAALQSSTASESCSNFGAASQAAAEALCPALANNPLGPFPADCAAFDQLGVRVPLIAISPFSKPGYVSHVVGDHASLLAFIEKRFLDALKSPHLTKRDAYANNLEDLFNFKNSPSLNTKIGTAIWPHDDCTPAGTSNQTLLRGHKPSFTRR
jgi:phospholipase C